VFLRVALPFFVFFFFLLRLEDVLWFLNTDSILAH